MRRTGIVLAVWMVGTLTACGGAKKDASDPSVDPSFAEAGEDDEGRGQDAQGPSPEKYDEIASAFRMRRPSVARCYGDAIEAGTVSKKARGRVTVAMSISPNGKAGDLKVTNTTLRSKVIEDCVLDMIRGWQLPEPGATCQFSFSYEFEPEYSSGEGGGGGGDEGSGE